MAYLPVAGIYEIRNTLNNKVYIGSSINVNKRMASHKHNLKRGAHSSAHLQASWNKSGAQAFQFKQLIACAPKDLMFYEQRIMDGYKANQPEFGYNTRLVVESCAGMKLSAAHKAKIAASVPRGENHQYFGVGLCAKAYQAAADLKRGKPMLAEQRAKISASSKGKKKHDGFGALISAAKRGMKFSDEARANMSAGRVGLILKKAHKENIGKLDYEKVEQIRVVYASGGVKQKELAASFGVDVKTINNVINRKTWS